MLSISYDEFHLGFLVFEALNGLFTAALSGLMIYTIVKNRKTNAPITTWSINVAESSKNMNILIVSSFTFIFVFLLYYLGTIDPNPFQAEVLKAAAEFLGIIVYLFVTWVIFSWFRLFKRFI